MGLVHPSSDEGFGLTPLEAMAAGIPTIVSNAGALPEVTSGAALLAESHDSEGWQAAISRLYEDLSLKASLIARGLARAASFRWQRVASETVAVHMEVLGSQRNDS
jgi:alpha-1,3-rhamnosyl/mannosyltransferase